MSQWIDSLCYKWFLGCFSLEESERLGSGVGWGDFLGGGVFKK